MQINPLAFRKTGLPAAVVFCLIMSAALHAQNVRIVSSAGRIAVINIGSDDGVRTDDEFGIMRAVGVQWNEVARARAVRVTPQLTRIELTDQYAGRSILESDRIVRFQRGGTASPSAGAARPSSPSTPRNVRGGYLGPTCGFFIPLSDMKEIFETRLGYGGILGLHFREDLDVSMRFFFAAKSTDWSFWNLQLLGRRYFETHFTFDFGYGIAYPRMHGAVGSGDIRLGFIGGLGFTFPVGMKTWFELGCLYHYYPQFGEKAGQFMTIQGRLLL
ncbi:MAG TPA: hypothetical protein ENN17_04825 [bacterium]|nr:hypothetical protein [bacterium]